jgi:hypothetical protein
MAKRHRMGERDESEQTLPLYAAGAVTLPPIRDPPRIVAVLSGPSLALQKPIMRQSKAERP